MRFLDLRYYIEKRNLEKRDNFHAQENGVTLSFTNKKLTGCTVWLSDDLNNHRDLKEEEYKNIKTKEFFYEGDNEILLNTIWSIEDKIDDSLDTSYTFFNKGTLYNRYLNLLINFEFKFEHIGKKIIIEWYNFEEKPTNINWKDNLKSVKK